MDRKDGARVGLRPHWSLSCRLDPYVWYTEQVSVAALRIKQAVPRAPTRCPFVLYLQLNKLKQKFNRADFKHKFKEISQMFLRATGT
jgi:hypothetical protein